MPACSFSTDFARAVLFVNECYNKYTSLIQNTPLSIRMETETEVSADRALSKNATKSARNKEI